MKQVIILLIALMLITITSCLKDMQIIQTEDQRFPNQIGDKWLYRLTTDEIDTVLVEIVGQGTLTNNDTIYFKEYIGLIKLIQHEYNLGPVPGNGKWELISAILY